MHWLRWLRPGYHIKRWVVVIIFGVALISYGSSTFFRNYFKQAGSMPPVLSYATLQFIRYPYRDLLLIGSGMVSLLIGLRFLAHALVSPFRFGKAEGSLMDALYEHRSQQRGPRIVVMGGDTGLAALVQSLKSVTESLTVVFGVPDTAKLDTRALIYERAAWYLLALSKAEFTMGRLLSASLAGSASPEEQMGKVLLETMSQISGNLEQGLRAMCDVLAVRGRVFPAFSPDVPKGISLPEGAERCAFSEVVRSLLDADLIILGPGIWGLELEPILAVYPLKRAIRMSGAIKIYVDTAGEGEAPQDRVDWADYIIVKEIETPEQTGTSQKKPRRVSIKLDEGKKDTVFLVNEIMDLYEPWARLGARYRTDD